MRQHSTGPWRRGIGNDANRIFDGQGSTVAERVGTTDGCIIACALAFLQQAEELMACVYRNAEADGQYEVNPEKALQFSNMVGAVAELVAEARR